MTITAIAAIVATIQMPISARLSQYTASSIVSSCVLLVTALVLAPNAALNIAIVLGLALLPGRTLIVGGLLAVSLAIDALGLAQMVALHFPRSQGAFTSPNWFGYYAVTHCFLAFARRDRLPRLGTIATLSNGIAVFLSLSRGSILAFGAGVCIMILPFGGRAFRGWPLALAAGGLSLALAILIPRAGHDARLAIWQLGLNAAMAHPWIGWRGGVMLLGSPGFYNVVLDWMLMTGILGLAVAAWAFVAAWRLTPTARPLLAAWLVNGLFISTTLPASLPLLAAMASPRSGCTDDRRSA